MGSFNIAVLALLIIIACGVPFLKVPRAAARLQQLSRCTTDRDCDLDCGDGFGFCYYTYCAMCVAHQKQHVVEGTAAKLICSKDSDCNGKIRAAGWEVKNCVQGRCL